MTTASFIQAMPKVEPNVQLDGAMPTKTLLMIAEQNEIAESLKHFDDWVRLVSEPEYPRIYEIVRMACSWLKHPDDLTRVVYDLGTSLAKQNVRYAEIGVNPVQYPDLDLSYDDFLSAINDGRDRARRAWGIEIGWVFMIPREEPRRADELARWTSTASARRGGVVALGVSGDENAQPVGQFERAFHTVEKKEIGRVARAGDTQGVEGVLKAIEVLHPHRLIDGRGAAESPEALTAIVENQVTLAVSPTRAAKQRWVASTAEYPLRKLIDNGVSVIIGSDMASLYHTSLHEEYTVVVDQCGLSPEELETLALNAVQKSFLPDEAKAEMVKTFTEAYAALRAEHIEPANA